jgi:hypothetical protein
MQIGDPLGDGWAIYKRFWRHLLPIAFVVSVVVSLAALALSAAGDRSRCSRRSSSRWSGSS